MADMVLVVHGIDNRDPSAFEAQIQYLKSRTNDAYTFIPGFWGELGGISEGLSDALPVMREVKQREDYEKAGNVIDWLGQVHGELVGDASGEQEIAELLTRAVRGHLGIANHPTKANQVAGDSLDKVVLESIRSSEALRLLTPPELEQAGALIADFILADQGDTPDGLPSDNLKGLKAAASVSEWASRRRGPLRRFMDRIDEFAGRLISNGGGAINQAIRRSLSDGIAQTLGDIVVYHEKKKSIHTRLYNTLRAVDKTLGSEENPLPWLLIASEALSAWTQP